MAKAKRTGEELWREAWVKAEFSGTVIIDTDPGSGEEMLMLDCREVVQKFGEKAVIVDDGRTVGICVDDHVAFGVVRRPGRAPLAVNVYRLVAKRRRVDGKGKGKKGEKGEQFVMPTELPESLQGDVPGVIRNQSLTTGDYFIACPLVFNAYKRDAKIPVQEMPTGVGIGDTITFNLAHPDNERMSPTANNIQRKAGAEAEEIYAKTYPWKGAGKGKDKGKGKGKGGFKGPKGKYAPAAAGAWESQTVMRMVGTVKHKSPATGQHFVLCQDISDVYGKDAQIPVEEMPEGGLKVGDRIAFDVAEPRGGQQGLPLARHVRIVGTAGTKRKAAPGAGDGDDDAGDGEPEEEVEVEEEEEPELEEEKEVELDGEDLADADEEARLQAEAGETAEAEATAAAVLAAAEEKAIKALEAVAVAEEAPAPRFALTWAKAAKSGKTGTVKTASTFVEEKKAAPVTPEEWAERQDEMFPGMSELRRGWIRIRSASKGLVYFYNMQTGESRTEEPSKWLSMV